MRCGPKAQSEQAACQQAEVNPTIPPQENHAESKSFYGFRCFGNLVYDPKIRSIQQPVSINAAPIHRRAARYETRRGGIAARHLPD